MSSETNDKNTNIKISGIILAGGRGTRMKSQTPKLMHRINKRPLIEWAIEHNLASKIDQVCVILGENYQEFSYLFEKYPHVSFCQQLEAKGTADAVAATHRTLLNQEITAYAKGIHLHGPKFESGACLVSTGDTPGVDHQMLNQLIDAFEQKNSDLCVMGFSPEDNFGYGRLVQASDQSLEKIVEEKEASEEQKQIEFCNSGILIAKTKELFVALSEVTNQNLKQEYYLTDVVEKMNQKSLAVDAYQAEPWQAFQGVNTQEQLASISDWMNKKGNKICAEL